VVNPPKILTAHNQNTTRRVTALANMGVFFTLKESVRGMTLQFCISEGHRWKWVGCIQKTDSALQGRHAEIWFGRFKKCLRSSQIRIYRH